MIIGQVKKHLKEYGIKNTSICVGLSGGVDSVVLMYILNYLKGDYNLNISAVYVNHNISRNSHDWGVSCENFAKSIGVNFCSFSVNATKNQADVGLEASARAERYNCFKMINANYIALAHHQDDQVETMMLQLLRGAGCDGVSGMELVSNLNGSNAKLFRPLLDVKKSDLIDFAIKNNLSWIEDESNFESEYKRNFLRNDVLPLIEKQFPSYRKTLSRSSKNMHETVSLLEDLAAFDYGDESVKDIISIKKINSLSLPRAKNMIRWFLKRNSANHPSVAQLDELIKQCRVKHPSKCLSIKWGIWEFVKQDKEYFKLVLQKGLN